MEQSNRFGEFIANLRREKQISLEQLCDGLCDCSTLSRFEHGEREAEKLLQNRFLTRLGIVPENYENFLYYPDYCRWEKRQGILHNILEENIEEAKVQLEEYGREYDMNDALEKQFYLAMLAQILRYEGCEQEKLAALFAQALDLTIPNVGTQGFKERILSLEEINLLLEYVYCSGETLQWYEGILEYIERMEQTLLAMAKIYPKAVYYYYLAWEKSEQKEVSMALQMLELCDKAIEILRDANRMFFLWELFCMKEQLIPLLPREVQESETTQKSLAECLVWKTTLEEIYRDYGVTIGMYEFCYLYVESENYCIGDVVRIRRKMLKLSQKTLAAGLCDERTVSRLESNKNKPQREVVQGLLERLNLPTELNRTELVTDSQEAIETYRELRRQNNNRNYEKVEALIEELKGQISMEIPSNAQVVARNELYNQYIHGKYSEREYIDKMKRVLECTVPYKMAVGKREKYLTNEEIACLQNITLETGWIFPEMDECVSALIRVCENTKYSENYIRIYEYLMVALSSHLGDKGEYEYSNRIKHNVISMSLKTRRMKAIDNATYGIIWNDEQLRMQGLEMDLQSKQKKIMRCIQMSDLSKQFFRKKMYEEKLLTKEIY